MIALDTNVLMPYLKQDDQGQADIDYLVLKMNRSPHWGLTKTLFKQPLMSGGKIGWLGMFTIDSSDINFIKLVGFAAKFTID